MQKTARSARSRARLGWLGIALRMEREATALLGNFKYLGRPGRDRTFRRLGAKQGDSFYANATLPMMSLTEDLPFCASSASSSWSIRPMAPVPSLIRAEPTWTALAPVRCAR